MKIIAKDNFDRELYDEQIVIENVSKFYGIKFTKWLNDETTENSNWFYELVEDDYKLKTYSVL